MIIARVLFASIVSIVSLAPLASLATEKLVTVTGEATIAVAPDSAMIRIGVSSQDKTAREASDANARQMTAVLAAIKSNSIADRDIQTSRLSLQPQYDPNKSGTARLTGFQATNQVTVRIRDIGNLAPVLDSAISAGANEMSGIELCESRGVPARSCRRDFGRGFGTTAARDAGSARRRRPYISRRADVKGGRDR
jgi:uncharacterized protein YggE